METDKSNAVEIKKRLVIYPTKPEMRAAKKFAKEDGQRSPSGWLAVQFRKIIAARSQVAQGTAGAQGEGAAQ